MNDSELDRLLTLSGVPVEAPESFQRDVWCRIETADFAGWKPWFDQVVERLLSVVARPPVAFATCAAMVVAGAWLGLNSATPLTPGDVVYVQSISPFAQPQR